MDVLLREVRLRPEGVEEYHDTEVTVDEITLGAGPEEVIQLLGEGIARQHAVLKSAGGGRARITCQRGNRVTVNGKDVGSANLEQGDRIDLVGHRLDLMTAPSGFELAIVIRRNLDVQNSAFEKAFQTHLEETWLGKRGPAWALLALVLAVTLGVPLALLSPPGAGQGADDRASTISAARLAAAEAKTHPLVPTDRLWSTGPLLPAHQLAIGDDCTACHTTLFERVQDDACTSCHDKTLDHVTAERSQLLALETHRCATCHLEHNEPVNLVVRADRLCTDCHSEPSAFKPLVELDPATGFTMNDHPSFDAYLLKSTATEGGTGLVFDWNVHIESLAGAQEESHLKFPHDVHLDGTRVQKPTDGTAMGCTDCHTLSPDQEHFLPITMEADCRECHDLKFDPDDPTRELPHGEPREVVRTIEGHFMSKFADPNGSRGDEGRRRLPGRERATETCTGSVFECGRKRTELEAVNQFSRRGCITCHDVFDNGGADLTSRFQVYPVRLATDYFPTARFDHTSHLTQRDASGDAACLTCHRADVADSSDIILVPDIDNCVECHGDARLPELITLQCVDCHAYHPLKLIPSKVGMPEDTAP